ncbi:MAG: hypothetical protein JSW11_09845 [Candidatus Heimdallarchaeota archaeon]|nr:MAG: hypothetical protein JSW11_09845 [Candidatus Heimdallarchaeota archaeon]
MKESDLQNKVKELEKLEKKKKWDSVIKLAIELAEYYLDKKDFPSSLQYFEKAISAQEKGKEAEKVIVLYRKIIGAARKGRTKTRKELFRYAAAATPLIEEYIQVLKESNRYISKHGAMTRYFLGECREIVSGITQRNDEFVQAGQIFLEVGQKFSSTKKTEEKSDEAFERARAIFNLINNKEETFEAFLLEAEINIQKYRFERGFLLFDDARGLFDDDEHQEMVVNREKVVYAEMGLKLVTNYFSDSERHKIAMMLISKAREAHLLAKSLDQVPEMLFEIGRIHIENGKLENGFNFLDEARTNSQLVNDETTPKKIIDYLFHEGKKQVDNLSRPLKIKKLENLSNLPFTPYFDKMEEICKELNLGQEVEEVALYIWQLGLDLLEQRDISDDFPFIEKAITYLLNNNRINGIHIIGDELEKRLEQLAAKRQLDKFQNLKTFLVDCYTRIDDNQSAGFLTVKVGQTYASWGNYEKQVASLREASSLFQNSDHGSIKKFSEVLEEQFTRLEAYVPDSIFDEVLFLLGNTYLQVGDDDKYDSLFASTAHNALEKNEFTKAMQFHQQDFDFLVRTKNYSRALARVEEFSTALYSRGKYQLANNLRVKQIKLMIDTNASQEQVLQTIKNLEDQIEEGLTQKIDITSVNDLFSSILNLYDYLGVKEALGDALFEMAVRLFEFEYFDPGFEYLNRAYEKVKEENAIEKYGLLLDFAFEKKNFYQDLVDLDTSDRFLDFLILVLRELNQIKEAAELIMTRAVRFVLTDENKAWEQFEQAKELISQTESPNEVLYFYQDFGSALLKAGKIDEGMETLAKAEGSTSTNSLAIADTCLTVAKDRFTVQDYDTYFILVDRALSIYTDLEMFQESSSIALAEARKLWSVDNLPYTMIYLERAWAPLAMTYDEKLEQSIQPVLQTSEEFVNALFGQKKYDEAKNFLEFQERIYKQLNLTDKILEVERKKIDALIGRGNIDGALSQALDMATIGIEELKFKETAALLKDLLPPFIINAPNKAKDLLKIFINLLLTMEPKDMAQEILYETLDYLIMLTIRSHTNKRKELFEEQVNLFFNALTEVAEAEHVLAQFIIRFGQEMTKLKEYSYLFNILKQNISYLLVVNPVIRMKIINEINALLEYHDLTAHTIIEGLDFLNNLTQNIDNQNRETLSRIFFVIGMKRKSQKEIYEHAMHLALEQAKITANIPATLDLLYGLIEEDLKTGNFLNASRRLDEAIEYLDHAPQTGMGKKFAILLEDYITKLKKQKKEKFTDLLTAKHEMIQQKFIN